MAQPPGADNDGGGRIPWGPNTCLYYLRAREYDPITAQFLSRDPIASETLEAYSYVSDSPLDGTDATGLKGTFYWNGQKTTAQQLANDECGGLQLSQWCACVQQLVTSVMADVERRFQDLSREVKGPARAAVYYSLCRKRPRVNSKSGLRRPSEGAGRKPSGGVSEPRLEVMMQPRGMGAAGRRPRGVGGIWDDPGDGLQPALFAPWVRGGSAPGEIALPERSGGGGSGAPPSATGA